MTSHVLVDRIRFVLKSELCLLFVQWSHLYSLSGVFFGVFNCYIYSYHEFPHPSKTFQDKESWNHEWRWIQGKPQTISVYCEVADLLNLHFRKLPAATDGYRTGSKYYWWVKPGFGGLIFRAKSATLVEVNMFGTFISHEKSYLFNPMFLSFMGSFLTGWYIGFSPAIVKTPK